MLPPLALVGHVYDPSTWRTEVGGSQVQVPSGQPSETLTQKKRLGVELSGEDPDFNLRSAKNKDKKKVPHLVSACWSCECTAL